MRKMRTPLVCRSHILERRARARRRASAIGAEAGSTAAARTATARASAAITAAARATTARGSESQ